MSLSATSTADAIQATRAILSRDSGPANPSTPVLIDNVQWITAYLVVHMMSENSRRYMYYLWMIIALIALTTAALHWSGFGNGIVGAYWNKWAWRRRTWRGQHALKLSRKQGRRVYPVSLPSNGQLLCIIVLFAVAIILCVVGPDYISPSSSLLGVRRDVVSLSYAQALDDTSQYTGFQPNYEIPRAWWTLGGRTGLIAFAFIPLCVLFALKTPPFALFALPIAAQYHFDKLAWLHRWSGRLIWLLTALHVAFWSVQLFRDQRSTTIHEPAYNYAWLYTKFLYGWAAFGLMTILIAASSSPLRRHHYEAFYFLHVLFVPLTLVTSALHHPPVGIWCWSALGIWIAERAWRAARWLYLNGIFSKRTASTISSNHRGDSLQSRHPILSDDHSKPDSPLVYPPLPHPERKSVPSLSQHRTLTDSVASYLPPYGFASAELLSGATIRLTYIAPGNTSWAPGQNYLITVPSVSSLTSHPFTVASVCDEEADARVMTFLVGAKSGWTRDLWDHITDLLSRGLNRNVNEGLPDNVLVPANSVLLHMWIDGPFGSAVRARWDRHSTILIIVGGTGVSFGTALLEYLSLCMSGRDGRKLGGQKAVFGRKKSAIRRVRFVWLIREFAHIQWCASIIRRCQSIVSPSAIAIDIFVTNFSPQPKKPLTDNVLSSAQLTSDTAHLEPPKPQYASRKRTSSISSTCSSEGSFDSLVDLSYYTGDFGDEEQGVDSDIEQHRDYTLELTNFDGDNADTLPGEEAFSKRVQRSGKKQRAINRKTEKALAAKAELNHIARGADAIPVYRHDARRQSAQSTDFLLRHSIPAPQHHERSESLSSAEFDLHALPVTTVSDALWHLPHEPASAGADSQQTLRLVTSTSAAPSHPSPLGPTRPPTALRSSSPSPTASRMLNNPTSPLSPISPQPSSSISQSFPGFPGENVVISRPSSAMSHTWEGGSEATHSVYSMTAMATDGNQTRLEVRRQDILDVEHISQNARIGKPLLDRILQDELSAARGSIVVACCGPSSLNAKVRKTIAVNVKPGKNKIDLVSEDFAY